MNRSPNPVNLKDWSILNKTEQARLITEDVNLPPGGIHAVEMGDVPLSNKGGLLTLLDNDGIKIDGVSYTKQQAQKEGYVVIFRQAVRARRAPSVASSPIVLSGIGRRDCLLLGAFLGQFIQCLLHLLSITVSHCLKYIQALLP